MRRSLLRGRVRDHSISIASGNHSSRSSCRPRAAIETFGTGTGVTPLRSMIRDALNHGDTSPMTLLFGVRTEADRLYQDELDALAAQHLNLRVLYTLSRPSPTWTGLTGYVQTHVERLYREVEAQAPAGIATHVYACGLERMVGAVRDLLRKSMNVDRKRVHSERYD